MRGVIFFSSISSSANFLYFSQSWPVALGILKRRYELVRELLDCCDVDCNFKKEVFNDRTSRHQTSLAVARVSDGGSYLKAVSTDFIGFLENATLKLRDNF